VSSTLRITEIFFSLQGETRSVGLPTVFVRLLAALCAAVIVTPLAFNGGQVMENDDILKQVASYGAHYVTVTGGEPLAQKGLLTFIE